jgi:hypothetical protein
MMMMLPLSVVSTVSLGVAVGEGGGGDREDASGTIPLHYRSINGRQRRNTLISHILDLLLLHLLLLFLCHNQPDSSLLAFF